MIKHKFDTYGQEPERSLDLTRLWSIFEELGVVRLYTKALSANDNSKNQVYFRRRFFSS